jgi:PelA/Pel-15E family pectate lyase
VAGLILAGALASAGGEASTESVAEAGSAVAATPIGTRPNTTPTSPIAIDTAGFRDSANHWRRIRDPGRFIQPLTNQPAYAPTQVREIAANLLLFQRANGGWPKDYDMTAVLTEEQKAAVRATHERNDTSFDNGNLHSQVAYLAEAYAALGEPAWREAGERGLDFLLAAQYANGGFPQRHPKPTGFHAHITFNDYVMIGILNVLQDAADSRPHFAWLDAARRERARDAVRRGVDCILKCQIRVDGKLTGWCQQHDEQTFEARPARPFELASLCPQDTTYILRFLMRLESPSEAVVRTVEAAGEWLRRTQLSGVKVQRVQSPATRFEKHDADFDVVVVEDAQAPPLWARHYEISTDRPIFAGRDGRKRFALAEIDPDRRTGSIWYGTWPQALLDRDLPQWRARLRATNAQPTGPSPAPVK